MKSERLKIKQKDGKCRKYGVFELQKSVEDGMKCQFTRLAAAVLVRRLRRELLNERFR